MSVTGAEACVWASISTERVTGNQDERASVTAPVQHRLNQLPNDGFSHEK
jgi:hypothetical protein